MNTSCGIRRALLQGLAESELRQETAEDAPLACPGDLGRIAALEATRTSAESGKPFPLFGR